MKWCPRTRHGVVVPKHKVTRKPIQSAFVSCMPVFEWRCKGRFHTFIYTNHLYYRLMQKFSIRTCTSFVSQFHKLMTKYEICMNKFQSFQFTCVRCECEPTKWNLLFMLLHINYDTCLYVCALFLASVNEIWKNNNEHSIAWDPFKNVSERSIYSLLLIRKYWFIRCWWRSATMNKVTWCVIWTKRRMTLSAL